MSVELSRQDVPGVPAGGEGPARAPGRASLARERDILATIVENADALVLVVDRDGAVIRLNRACEEASGRTLPAVRGQPFWRLVEDSEQRATARAAFRALRTRGFPGAYESWWTAPDGMRRCIAFSHTALFDREGTVEAIVCTGIDVTAQKALERALVASDSRLRALADALPGGVAFIDATGRCVLGNRAFLAFCAGAPDRVEGRELREILGDTIYAALEEPLLRALAGEQVDVERVWPGCRSRLRAVFTPHACDDTAGGCVMVLQDVQAAS